MAPKLSYLVLLAILLPAASSAAAAAASFDIGKILSDYPEFSIFNSLLSGTGLARAINSREVVTILAANNTAVSAAFRGVPRLPHRLLADLLALHVVLDYLDAAKLAALRHGRTGDGSVVTTLLQGTGAARGRGAGFLRVAAGKDGRVTFSSAATGGPRNATLEREVTAQPYSVSVLQVSGFVFPPGIITPQPPPPRARHMSLPPSPAPAPGPEPQLPPVSGSGPLLPTPIRPVPTPNLTNTPPPPSAVIPIPSVHGGVAAKVPSAAGHGAVSWWSGAGVTLWIMACLGAFVISG